jgi:hypothetical protein
MHVSLFVASGSPCEIPCTATTVDAQREIERSNEISFRNPERASFLSKSASLLTVVLVDKSNGCYEIVVRDAARVSQ